MKRIAIVSKRTPGSAEPYEKTFRQVYLYLKRKGKMVFVERQIAEVLKLKKYSEFTRGKTDVDLILVMGGDGTILSVVQRLSAKGGSASGRKKLNTRIFGINTGTLGFMSEIPPVGITRTLNKIFDGQYSIDRRPMIEVQVWRGKAMIKKFHALNEAAITQGELARLIRLRTTVNQRKLTTYHADGLIIATPTGSTAYSLSAGGPIVYPSLNAFIITPICPHSFTQKPIVIPDSKIVEVVVEDNHRSINLTLDGQESFPLTHKDRIRIQKDGVVQFIRMPTESFFSTLRSKLHWGKEAEG